MVAWYWYDLHVLFCKYKDILDLCKHSVTHNSMFDVIGNFSQGIFNFRGPYEKISLNIAIYNVFNKFT